MNNDLNKEFTLRIGDLHVEHAGVKRAWAMFDSVRKHRNLAMLNKDGNMRRTEMTKKHRHILLTGKSGTGKSELAMKYALKANPIEPYYDEELDADIDIVKVAYMETPENFGRLEFFQIIAEALGAPRLPGNPKVGEARKRAIDLLKKQKTEMLIMDEIDYLITSNSIGKLQAMECIKYVTNNAGVSLVCIGSPKAKELRNLDLQYFRRFAPLELKMFESCNEGFCKFLQDLEEQIEPDKAIGLGDMSTYLPQILYKMSKGLVGILTPLIIEAYNQLGILDESSSNSENISLMIEAIEKAYNIIVGDSEEKELERLLEV